MDGSGLSEVCLLEEIQTWLQNTSIEMCERVYELLRSTNENERKRPKD